MSKNQIISRCGIGMLCLGIFVWALFTLPAGAIVFLVIILLVAYIDYRRMEKNNVKGSNSELNMAGLTAKYGEPDNIIVTNPTRGNEVTGCILVYRTKGLFIINGLEVKKSEIEDYILKNEGSTPYMPADYYLRLSTTLENYPWISVSVGCEISWAEQVLTEFQNELAD